MNVLREHDWRAFMKFDLWPYFFRFSNEGFLVLKKSQLSLSEMDFVTRNIVSSGKNHYMNIMCIFMTNKEENNLCM